MDPVIDKKNGENTLSTSEKDNKMECVEMAVACESSDCYAEEAANLRLERRAENRQRVQSPIHVAFYNKGNLYRGNIINLSSEGATLMFIAEPSGTMPALLQGRDMECYILSRKGRSKCRGRVQWKQQNSNRLVWGISFTELSHDKDDPLRLLIDEACYGSSHEEFRTILSS